MSQVEGTQQVPAGWYPDHTGEPRMRWWDGQQWTEHVSELAPSGVVPGQVIPRNTVPATTPLGNPFIWVLVLLPIVSYVASGLLLLTVDWNGYFSSIYSGDPTASLAIYGNPALFVPQLLGFAIYAATVVLAYFDWRRLGRNGVPRPFHWAWAFLTTVYVIGRSVVVWRRAHRGLAPLWVYIVVFVAGLVFVTVSEVHLFSAMMQNLPSYGSYSSNS